MHSIVLLTHDTAFGHHMAQRFAASVGVRAVLVFRRRRPRLTPVSRILQVVRSISPLRRLEDSLALHILGKRERFRRRRVERVEARLIAEADAWFLKAVGDDPGWPVGVEVRTVNDVNAPETVAWLADIGPDVLAVAGGPILRGAILSIPRHGGINFHSSLLPQYRGTFAEFWQACNQDYDRAGITFHRIDAGADTGAILYQQPTAPKPGEDPWRLRCRNQIAALSAMPRVIGDALAGALKDQPQPPGDKAYRASDVTLAAREEMLARIGVL